MSVLIITNKYLDGKTGGSVASLGFINAFPLLYSDCYLIYPVNGEQSSPRINPGLKRIPCNDNRKKWEKGVGVYFGRIHRFSKLARKTIIEMKPKIVVFDTSIVSHGLIEIVKKNKVKIITIHHNVERDYFSDNPPPLIIRFPYRFYIKRAERKCVQKSDLNLTLTMNDKSRLTELYTNNRKPDIECLGVFEPYKVESVLNTENERKDRNTIKLAITGSLGYSQSNLSIIKFVNDYFPGIVVDGLKFETVIAGSNPSDELKHLCDDKAGLKLISNPGNLSEIIAESDIYLCPVGSGSGLKLRIMDALRLGKPVIAHEISARGYEQFVNAGFIFIYSDVPTFRKCIREVTSREFNRDEIRKLFFDVFSFSNGVARLSKLLSGDIWK
jgi:glycosyltransferase involved in cell wall biosynthesis